MTILRLDDQENLDATLDDVVTAIRALDGSIRTLVLIELPSGKSLTIGGGPDRLVAEVAENDFDRWALIDPTKGDDPVDLVVGGQLVDYPARLCVSMQSVLDAAHTFVRESGARSAHLVWSVET